MPLNGRKSFELRSDATKRISTSLGPAEVPNGRPWRTGASHVIAAHSTFSYLARKTTIFFKYCGLL